MLVVRGFIIFLGVCLMCNSVNLFGQEVIDEEYDLKAAYIYHFTKYIAWNSDNASEEFVIGVLGETPIGSLLKDNLEQKNVCNKKVTVKQFSNVKAYNQAQTNCQILFVAKSLDSQTLNQLSTTSLEKTLVIGEQNHFIENGGLVNFVIKRNKLKFELNQSLMMDIGFKVSSQLLRLAIINNHYSTQTDSGLALANCNL